MRGEHALGGEILRKFNYIKIISNITHRLARKMVAFYTIHPKRMAFLFRWLYQPFTLPLMKTKPAYQAVLVVLLGLTTTVHAEDTSTVSPPEKQSELESSEATQAGDTLPSSVDENDVPDTTDLATEVTLTQSRLVTLRKNHARLMAVRKKGGLDAQQATRIATLERAVSEAISRNETQLKEFQNALTEVKATEGESAPSAPSIIKVDTQGERMAAFKGGKKLSLGDIAADIFYAEESLFEPMSSTVSHQELDAEFKRIQEEMVGIFTR